MGLSISSVNTYRYEPVGRFGDLSGDLRRAQQAVGLDRQLQLFTPDNLQQPGEVGM